MVSFVDDGENQFHDSRFIDFYRLSEERRSLHRKKGRTCHVSLRTLWGVNDFQSQLYPQKGGLLLVRDVLLEGSRSCSKLASEKCSTPGNSQGILRYYLDGKRFFFGGAHAQALGEKCVSTIESACES